MDLYQKRDILQTTNSRGWSYIKQIAEDVVRAMERTAIDEDDEAKGATLRRHAKAARAFLSDFLNRVDVLRQAEVPEKAEPLSDDEFYEVNM